MKIHELNTFSGTPGSGNYLAIDNGTDTGKISGEKLLKGVTPTKSGNSIQIGNMLIQWGQINITAEASGYTDSYVDFPTRYNSVPAVQLTTISASTAAAFALVEICLNSVDSSGFSMRAFNNGSTGRAPAVYWMAVGFVS